MNKDGTEGSRVRHRDHVQIWEKCSQILFSDENATAPAAGEVDFQLPYLSTFLENCGSHNRKNIV